MCTPLRQITSAQTFIMGPFIDDTDFKTPQTALTITPADFSISKAGAPPGTKSDATNASHIANGYYLVTVNSADTGDVGELHVSVHKAGTLVVGKDIEVLVPAIYDALHGSSANGFASNGAVFLTGGSIDAIWEELTADHSGVSGSVAESLAIAAGDPWITLLPGTYTAGQAGKIVGDALTGHIPQTGDNFNRIGSGGINLFDLGGMSSNMKTEMKDHIWTQATLVAFNVPGSMGSAMNQIASGITDVNVVQWKGVTAPDPMVITDFFTGGAPLNTTGGVLNTVTTASNVQTDCDAALVANHLDHLLAVAYNATTPPGVANSLWNEILEDDGGGNARFTVNALSNVAAGTGDWTIAERDMIRYRIGVDGGTQVPVTNQPQLGVLTVNLVEIAGTALAGEVVAGALANNFHQFYNVTPTTSNTINDVGAGSAGGFWSAQEQSEIRQALGVAGTKSATANGNLDSVLVDTNDLVSNRTLPSASYATAASQGLAQSDLDIITGSDGVTLATAQPNYAVSTLTEAQVKQQMVDALSVDTYAEPGQETPAITNSLVIKVGYLYKQMINKNDLDGSVHRLYNAAGTVVDQQRNVVDDTITSTKGQMITG